MSEPIVGFRTWGVEDGRLRAWGHLVHRRIPDAWGDSTTPALCAIRQEHSAPVWGCSCGFHVTKTPNAAMNWTEAGTLTWIVGGVCLVWGRVVEHELGFRAEYARPLALMEGAAADGLSLPAFADMEHLLAFASEFGDVSHLRAAA